MSLLVTKAGNETKLKTTDETVKSHRISKKLCSRHKTLPGQRGKLGTSVVTFFYIISREKYFIPSKIIPYFFMWRKGKAPMFSLVLTSGSSGTGVRSLSPFCFYFCRHVWWPLTLCFSATQTFLLQAPDVAPRTPFKSARAATKCQRAINPL